MFGDGQTRQLKNPVSQRLSQSEPMLHEKCIQQLERLTIMSQHLTAAVERYAKENKAMQQKITVKFDEVPQSAQLQDLASIHPEVERLKLDNYKLSEQLKQDFYRPDNYFRGTGKALQSAQDQKKVETIKMLKKQLEIVRTQCLKIASKGGNTLEIEKYERMQRQNTALKQFLRQRMGRGRAGPIPNHIRRIIGNRAQPALDYTKVVAPEITNMQKINRQLQRQIEQLNEQQKLMVYRLQLLQANHAQSQQFNTQLKGQLSTLANRQALNIQMSVNEPLAAQVKALQFQCARLRQRLALQHVQQNEINHQLNVAAQMEQVQNDIQVSRDLAMERQKAMEQQLYQQRVIQQQQLQAMQQEIQANHMAMEMQQAQQAEARQRLRDAQQLRQLRQMQQVQQVQQGQQVQRMQQVQHAQQIEQAQQLQQTQQIQQTQPIPMSAQTLQVVPPAFQYTDSATFVEQVPPIGGVPLLVNQLATRRLIEQSKRRHQMEAIAQQRQSQIRRQQQQAMMAQQAAAQQVMAQQALTQQQLLAQQQSMAAINNSIARQQNIIAQQNAALQHQQAVAQQVMAQQQTMTQNALAQQQLMTQNMMARQAATNSAIVQQNNMQAVANSAIVQQQNAMLAQQANVAHQQATAVADQRVAANIQNQVNQQRMTQIINQQNSNIQRQTQLRVRPDEQQPLVRQPTIQRMVQQQGPVTQSINRQGQQANQLRQNRQPGQPGQPAQPGQPGQLPQPNQQQMNPQAVQANQNNMLNGLPLRVQNNNRQLNLSDMFD